MSAPIFSMLSAISKADFVAVPLKSMCSMKCEMPLFSAVSFPEPVFTNTPTATERTYGRRS